MSDDFSIASLSKFPHGGLNEIDYPSYTDETLKSSGLKLTVNN